MTTKQEYVHPALRVLAANDTAPEQPLDLQLTYSGLIAQITQHAGPDGIHSARQLPELSLEHLALVLQHYPDAFVESMADANPDIRDLCIERLGNSAQTVSQRYAHVGLLVVGYIRGYVRGLVLRDVQRQWECNRRHDAIVELLAPSEERAAVRQGELS